MKKRIMTLIAILIAFGLSGCAALIKKDVSIKTVTVCNVINDKDCLNFNIPEYYPDFMNEFRSTTFCMGVYPNMYACFWYDGEKMEDETIPTATWYTAYFWYDGATWASTTLFSLMVEDHIDFEENWARYYIYDEKGIPTEKSKYEYHMTFWDLEGIPHMSEEKFKEQEAKDKAELKKYLDELKKEQDGQIDT